MSATLQADNPAAIESGNNYPRRQTLPVYIFSHSAGRRGAQFDR
jgi:hypothetical protein